MSEILYIVGLIGIALIAGCSQRKDDVASKHWLRFAGIILFGWSILSALRIVLLAIERV